MDEPIYPLYLALVRLGSGTPESMHIFMAASSGELQAFPSLGEGLRFFEEGYARSHARGYETSISACINHLFFEPWIVQISSLEKIVQAIGEPPYKLIQARHISGFMKGIAVLPSEADVLKSQGVKPKLIG